MQKPIGRAIESNAGAPTDPLGELMKNLYNVYLNPVGGKSIWTPKYTGKILHHSC